MGSISLNLTDSYQTPYTNAMQDLILKNFFFVATFGILYRIAQWIGFLEKDEDTPDGTPAKPGFAWHFFRFLVVP